MLSSQLILSGVEKKLNIQYKYFLVMRVRSVENGQTRTVTLQTPLCNRGKQKKASHIEPCSGQAKTTEGLSGFCV